MKNKTAVKRLPPHRARFYFAPSYIESAAEWKATFLALVDTVLKDTKLSWSCDDEAFGDWTLAVRFDRTRFVMCARTGTFTIEEFPMRSTMEFGDADDSWLGPIDMPSRFLSKIATTIQPPHLYEEVQRVARAIGELNEIMLDRLKVAFRDGIATMEARKGSAQSKFDGLEQDELRGLKLDPYEIDNSQGWGESTELPDATSRSGERLYSLCVVSTQCGISPTPVARKPSTGDKRIIWQPDVYDPIVGPHAKTVMKLPRGLRSKVEAKRRIVHELGEKGLKVPPDTTLDVMLNKFWPSK